MKKNGNPFYKFLHWFTHHPWLKLISFSLAVMLWHYVRSEINKFNF